MPKFLVDALDRFRVLLTETLPYETPLLFSNSSLYRLFRRLDKDNLSIPGLIKRIYLPERLGTTLPYEYSIAKSIADTRVLSVVHPAVQMGFVDFYSEFGDYVAFLCSRSNFSLRAPTRIASAYYERAFVDPAASQLSEPKVEEEKDGFEPQERSAASYFAYRKYSLLHKFYESDEFIELEKRFAVMLKFDIARCFESIYTHSISWAIKSKGFSKATRNHDSFGSAFDELMRVSNHDETHGIVIGPESSRIFAEIILQSVDESIRRRLEEELQLTFMADYFIGRYVDDFFVFANSSEHCSTILTVAEQELRKFKLYINRAKTIESSVPFSTSQSIAKEKVRSILAKQFESSVDPKALRGNPAPPLTIFTGQGGNTTSAKVISDIKCEMKTAGAEYYGVVAYALGIIRGQLSRILQKKFRSQLEQEASHAVSFVVRLLDVSFFLYAMDMRVRPTYLICQIACVCKRAARFLGSDARDIIEKKLLDETAEAIYRRRLRHSGSFVELDNLLVLLRYIDPSFEMPEDRLAKCFGCKLDATDSSTVWANTTGYFELMSLLYLIGDSHNYPKLRNSILAGISWKFQNVESPSNHSELALLFADTLACPHIPQSLKQELAQKMSNSVFGRRLLQAELNELINFCVAHLHFWDWGGSLNLEYVLQKKELRTPYGD